MLLDWKELFIEDGEERKQRQDWSVKVKKL